MRINLVPRDAWYVLVVAAMIFFAFPPLIVGSLLREIERAFRSPLFDPSRGGDPLMWQHLFRLFGQPEVYIVLFSVALIAITSRCSCTCVATGSAAGRVRATGTQHRGPADHAHIRDAAWYFESASRCSRCLLLALDLFDWWRSTDCAPPRCSAHCDTIHLA